MNSRVHRRDFLRGLAFGTLGAALPKSASGGDPGRPNMLFILFEEMGCEDV
jgi:hypothetical protein